jgi:hypothetical protein
LEYWSIVPRVVIFGLVYIVLGGMGLYNPRPLQRVFMDVRLASAG